MPDSGPEEDLGWRTTAPERREKMRERECQRRNTEPRAREEASTSNATVGREARRGLA